MVKIHEVLESFFIKFLDSKLSCYFLGGHAQNRTGIEGFAILCVTIPPRGPFYEQKIIESILCFISNYYMFKQNAKFKLQPH